MKFRQRPPELFAGGGELGELMRTKDWSRTALGPPEDWPQSLKTCVRIVLTSRQPMFVWWGDELINLYNDAYKAIVGGKHPDALGQPAEVVWREIWDQVGPRAETAMRRNEGTYDEALLLIMERYGYREETYYTFSYSPVPNDQGGTGGILCANTDDTQRIIGERQLALLRDLGSRTAEARTVQDACRLAALALERDRRDLPFALIYLLDPDKRRLELHGRAGIAVGHPAAPESFALDGARPWPVEQAVHGEPTLMSDLGAIPGVLPSGEWDRPPSKAALLPLVAQGESGTGGVLITGLNPYRLYDAGYQGFLRLAAGQIAAGIANAEAYQVERRRAEALAELDCAKTAFFSNVSHEFRTPLTLMLGPLEDVLNDALPAAHRERLDVAHRNSLRLLKLVNTLLDFSRIEAGRVQAAYEPTDLAALTADLASGFRSAIERAGLGLTIDCPPLPEPVFIDRDMWEKVVLNLLSNAFKFTFDGGIRVSLRTHDRAAVLSVADTGVGIPEHELSRVFERFHRIGGQRSRSFEGSGIGLALVHELVRLHGGSIAARSEPGNGTEFIVTIPFGTAHLPPERIGAARSMVSTATRVEAFVEEALRWLPELDSGGLDPAAAALADVAETAGASRATVLLADDNADMRDYLRRLLGARYDVIAVADGQAALDAIRERRPDLVISDVMMPRLGGFGLLRAIRADPALRDLPFVMLSARAGEEARAEGLDAGADDYLTKPFAARELLARVGANLAMAQVRRAADEALRQAYHDTREREERLHAAMAASDTGTFRWNPYTGEFLEFDENLKRLFGFARDEPVRVTKDFIARVHPDDVPQLIAAVDACRSGADFSMEYRVVLPGGGIRWLYDRAKMERDGDGNPTYLVGACTDITKRKEAEAGLRDESNALEILNRTGARIAAELDLERLVQLVCDAGVQLTGAQFGAFYNQTDEAGERYTLYTLSGASRDAFANYPMPRNTEVFGPTFRGEGTVRSDDITKDPRYGKNAPYYGMPEGHLPVRSYLAVPVVSRSGEVLGGLFFGHEQTGIFTERAERVITGLAAQAAIGIDNARLFQDVQRLNERLEARVAERTAELQEALAQLREEAREREKTEAALRQSHKMEAIGQLTGGIAHDFNNLLAGIAGSLELMQARLAQGRVGELDRYISAAGTAANRAAALTHRLLAFARRQALDPKPTNVNKLVSGMEELIRRTVGPAITLETVLAAGLWPTLCDANQLESALLNLCINARDAMPEGGRLTIETANAYLDAAYAASQREVRPGQYVSLSVSDTGTGMSADVLARAFEPFFTTKPIGQGTGLGLSMLYGFVKQSEGHVRIYSESGQGTTVRVYLPRHHSGEESDDAIGGAIGAEAAASAATGETVLVVEDEPVVRALIVEVLSDLGYTAMEATDGPSGLRILQSKVRVDLLITDVGLPGMNGRQLAEAARERRPGLKVLFITGYAHNAALGNGLLAPGVEMMAKPFALDALAAKIRAMIEG